MLDSIKASSFEVQLEQISAATLEVGELAADIGDQNRRFSEIGMVFDDEPEIKELAENGLAEEQFETFSNLRDLMSVNGHYFTELGTMVVVSPKETERLKAEFEDKEVTALAKEEELELLNETKSGELEQKSLDIIKNIERLSPKAVDQVKSYLGERSVSLSGDPDIDALENEIISLLETTEALAAEIEECEAREKALEDLTGLGRSWELPLVLYARSEYLEQMQLVLDEMPVEPKLSTVEHDKFKALTERHIDQPEATRYTALYLTEHPGMTVTVGELASFLYPDKVAALNGERSLRSRVTTLLGPQRLSDSLKEVLLAEGLVLQYGWRKILTLDGSSGRLKVAARHRIYRALPLDQIRETDLHGKLNTDEYSQEFEVTEDIKVLAAVSRHAGLEVSSPRSQGGNEGHILTPKDDTDNRKSTEANVGAHISVITPSVDTESKSQAINENETDITASSVPLNEQDTAGNNGLEKLGDWEKSFKPNITEAIRTLEEWGLLESSDSIKIATAKKMSRSGVFATPTSVNRVRQANLTPHLKRLKGNQIMEADIYPKDMVLMLLINRQGDILGKRMPHQARAVELIEKALEKYFIEKEKRDKAAASR